MAERAMVPTHQQRAMTSFDDGDVFSLARAFVESGYFQDTKSVSQAIVKIMAGREAGFGPMASIRGIHIIQGKPVWAAELIAAAIKRSKEYNYVVRKLDDTGCDLEFTLNGKTLGISSFGPKDAQIAKLASRDNWQSFPRNMYFARALTNGYRWYCPDVLGGMSVEAADGSEVELAEREREDLEARKCANAFEAVAPVNGIFRPTGDPAEEARNAAFEAQYADMADQSPLLPEEEPIEAVVGEADGRDISDKERLDIISEQLKPWRLTWSRCTTPAGVKNMRTKLEHAVSTGEILPEVRELLRRECKGLYEA